jgi:hypothetical protein
MNDGLPSFPLWPGPPNKTNSVVTAKLENGQKVAPDYPKEFKALKFEFLQSFECSRNSQAMQDILIEVHYVH